MKNKLLHFHLLPFIQSIIIYINNNPRFSVLFSLPLPSAIIEFSLAPPLTCRLTLIDTRYTDHSSRFLILISNAPIPSSFPSPVHHKPNALHPPSSGESWADLGLAASLWRSSQSAEVTLVPPIACTSISACVCACVWDWSGACMYLSVCCFLSSCVCVCLLFQMKLLALRCVLPVWNRCARSGPWFLDGSSTVNTNPGWAWTSVLTDSQVYKLQFRKYVSFNIGLIFQCQWIEINPNE